MCSQVTLSAEGFLLSYTENGPTFNIEYTLYYTL
jgi:hypothetical protein